MPQLTSLPCEVIAIILGDLDNLQDLMPVLLSCRHVHSSFLESKSRILRTIVQRQVTPDLLPYSMAVAEAYEVSRQPGPVTDAWETAALASAKRVLDPLFNEPSQLASQLRSLPADRVIKMGLMHNMVTRWANDFAADAWSLLGTNPGVSASALGSLSLSPTEHFMFRRAFYLMELFITLFPGIDEKHGHHFFSELAPWEIEQLVCVHDFLEKKFRQASLEFMMHDVGFWKLGVDYLSLGSDNDCVQDWLSQGLEFVDRIANEENYERKRDLLWKTIISDSSRKLYIQSSLMDALWGRNNFGSLAEYREHKMEAKTPRHALYNHDVNAGPRTTWVWLVNHEEDSFTHSSSRQPGLDSAGLKEQGYVMWDLDRIRRYDLLRMFETTPEMSSHSLEDDDDACDESLASCDERQEIWLRGGSGYWSEGDYSRIVWGEGGNPGVPFDSSHITIGSSFTLPGQFVT
ncbi:hypothetical protein F5B20DRAFT_553159 [Whalleya microplaca]|nr:hypothetical protein F5B20DRAFT_553159 [Whalleya microplaca]